VLANVYVDGFNLYYGCLKGSSYKWLDLNALSQTLLPGDDIHRIRYFTARIAARSENPSAHTRQDTYLRALRTIPHLTVHLGRFQRTIARMPLARPAPGGPAIVEVIKTEEKRTDVNLASHLLSDAFDRDCDVAVMITNDSDLAEPVRLLRKKYGMPIGIINPCKGASCSRDLASVRPTFIKHIRASALRDAQFPDEIKDQQGIITRPATW
jgi:uncharacterized LabA/DUF88 family protein